jgi:hypothetical protein
MAADTLTRAAKALFILKLDEVVDSLESSVTLHQLPATVNNHGNTNNLPRIPQFMGDSQTTTVTTMTTPILLLNSFHPLPCSTPGTSDHPVRQSTILFIER